SVQVTHHVFDALPGGRPARGAHEQGQRYSGQGQVLDEIPTEQPGGAGQKQIGHDWDFPEQFVVPPSGGSLDSNYTRSCDRLWPELRANGARSKKRIISSQDSTLNPHATRSAGTAAETRCSRGRPTTIGPHSRSEALLLRPRRRASMAGKSKRSPASVARRR